MSAKHLIPFLSNEYIKLPWDKPRKKHGARPYFKFQCRKSVIACTKSNASAAGGSTQWSGVWTSFPWDALKPIRRTWALANSIDLDREFCEEPREIACDLCTVSEQLQKSQPDLQTFLPDFDSVNSIPLRWCASSWLHQSLKVWVQVMT